MHPFDIVNLNNGAKLIFTPCPGTKDTTVVDALQSLKTGGADALVTLLPDTEIDALAVSGLGEDAKQQGLVWFQLPIEDDEEPARAFHQAWEAQKAALFEFFNAGKTLAIHCRGGSGRTGLMAAILLLESGESWNEIHRLIQSARPKALTHPAHLNFLKKYYSI